MCLFDCFISICSFNALILVNQGLCLLSGDHSFSVFTKRSEKLLGHLLYSILGFFAKFCFIFKQMWNACIIKKWNVFWGKLKWIYQWRSVSNFRRKFQTNLKQIWNEFDENLKKICSKLCGCFKKAYLSLQRIYRNLMT